MVWFSSITTEKIDSKELYDSLERFGISVTDIGTMVYVHGDVELKNVPCVVEICMKYGLKEFGLNKSKEKKA